MADVHSSIQTIHEQIEQVAKAPINDAAKAAALLRLAEAQAWLVSPAQPHGGSASSR